jgi:hypothetical protein
MAPAICAQRSIEVLVSVGLLSGSSHMLDPTPKNQPHAIRPMAV